MNHEIYISKTKRDERYKELKKQGIKSFRRVLTNVQLHPEYIIDAKDEGISYTSGFGNSDYKRLWGKLYQLEW